MELLFDQRKIPRTTTKQEWKEMFRWKRLTQRRLKEELDHRLMLAMCFGSSVIETDYKSSVFDEAINPPLLLGPHQ